MLIIPKYIENSGIVGASVTYDWKSNYQVILMDKVPKNLEKAIHSLSCKATFALVLGIGEWLIWRLNEMTGYKQVYFYIEALWASTIDESYLKEEELPTPNEKKDDPLYGALYGLEAALYNTTTNVILNHPDRAKTTAGLVSFVRYTLPNTAAFDSWLHDTIERLAKKFPYNIEEPDGVIVPRSFLEPDVALDEKSIPQLLNEQLSQIAYEQNPFLANPEYLKGSGFIGEPYRYSK